MANLQNCGLTKHLPLIKKLHFCCFFTLRIYKFKKNAEVFVHHWSSFVEEPDDGVTKYHIHESLCLIDTLKGH